MVEYCRHAPLAAVVLATLLFVLSSCTAPSAAPTAAVPAPVLVLSPDKMTFTMGPGQGPVMEQPASVINQGGGVISASVSDSAPWILVKRVGSLDMGQTLNAVVVVDATGMSPGSYTGTVTVTAEGAVNSPIQATIRLEILPGANVPPAAPAPVTSPAASSPQPGPHEVTWVNQADFYRYSTTNAMLVNGSITNNNRIWYMKNVRIVTALTGASVTIADMVPPGETVMYNRYIPSFQRQEVTLDYSWLRQ